MSKKSFSFRTNLDIGFLTFYIIISGILLAFSGGGFIVNFGQIGFSLMSGAQRSFFSVTSFFSGSITAIKDLSDLKMKYSELSNRLSDYELLQRMNADITVENQMLKDLLQFSQSIQIKNIPSEVIGRDPNNLYSGIIINHGARHGIRKNMPVISFQGSNTGLVGKVVVVGRNTSLVMPVFDFHSYVSVRLEKTRYEGLVNGQGLIEWPLVMKYVKKRAREEIKIGDKIVTSGENYLYPKDIPVGFVSKIRGLDYETSLELEIEPIIDFSRLEHVFVLDIQIPEGGLE